MHSARHGAGATIYVLFVALIELSQSDYTQQLCCLTAGRSYKTRKCGSLGSPNRPVSSKNMAAQFLEAFTTLCPVDQRCFQSRGWSDKSWTRQLFRYEENHTSADLRYEEVGCCCGNGQKKNPDVTSCLSSVHSVESLLVACSRQPQFPTEEHAGVTVMLVRNFLQKKAPNCAKSHFGRCVWSVSSLLGAVRKKSHPSLPSRALLISNDASLSTKAVNKGLNWRGGIVGELRQRGSHLLYKPHNIFLKLPADARKSSFFPRCS